MELIKTIRELRHEKERLDRVIASLEKLHATQSALSRGRRARKPMSLEERRAVSARMKRYWEDRHSQRRPWS